MDDLPELPFEKVLSYLSLGDLIKSRAISRRWYEKIKRLKVRSLCYSERPSGFIQGKSRLEFISSFKLFVNISRESILSNLKHLCLCGLDLNRVIRKTLAQTLNSFGQLEELDIIRFDYYPNDRSRWKMKLKLNLPMLNSIQLKEVYGMEELVLNAPRLQNVKLFDCYYFRVELVHQSVERLFDIQNRVSPLKNLKKLKYLYLGYFSDEFFFDPTSLSGLEQLKEIHLNDPENIAELFEQKRRYGRADLKIFLHGFLLTGPSDPETDSLFDSISGEAFVHLAENPWGLADEIPFCTSLPYAAIERVAPELVIHTVSRFIDLETICIDEPVQDVQRFLDFLKSFGHIPKLRFLCAQPQDLFDRLSEHCAVRTLFMKCAPSDFQFLLKLKHLNHLDLGCSFDPSSISRVFEELKFVSFFKFLWNDYHFRLEIDHLNRFDVCFGRKRRIKMPNLDAAIQFIVLLS